MAFLRSTPANCCNSAPANPCGRSSPERERYLQISVAFGPPRIQRGAARSASRTNRQRELSDALTDVSGVSQEEFLASQMGTSGAYGFTSTVWFPVHVNCLRLRRGHCESSGLRQVFWISSGPGRETPAKAPQQTDLASILGQFGQRESSRWRLEQHL